MNLSPVMSFHSHRFFHPDHTLTETTMYQLQMKIKGTWTNTVYRPMSHNRVEPIYKRLSDSYPDIDYRVIEISC